MVGRRFLRRLQLGAFAEHLDRNYIKQFSTLIRNNNTYIGIYYIQNMAVLYLFLFLFICVFPIRKQIISHKRPIFMKEIEPVLDTNS